MKISDFSPLHTQYSEKGINVIKDGGQEIRFLFCWEVWKYKRLKYKTDWKSVLGVYKLNPWSDGAAVGGEKCD